MQIIFLQEFLSGMKRKVKEPETVRVLKEAFRVFDSRGSGTVSRSTLMMAFLKTGQASMEEIEEMLEALDTNNDGCIELEDFLNIVLDQNSGNKKRENFDPKCCFL